MSKYIRLNCYFYSDGAIASTTIDAEELDGVVYTITDDSRIHSHVLSCEVGNIVFREYNNMLIFYSYSKDDRRAMSAFMTYLYKQIIKLSKEMKDDFDALGKIYKCANFDASREPREYEVNFENF